MDGNGFGHVRTLNRHHGAHHPRFPLAFDNIARLRDGSFLKEVVLGVWFVLVTVVVIHKGSSLGHLDFPRWLPIVSQD